MVLFPVWDSFDRLDDHLRVLVQGPDGGESEGERPDLSAMWDRASRVLFFLDEGDEEIKKASEAFNEAA